MRRRGQSTLEYAVIIAVVIAALIAIQTYVKRGVQGKLRSSVDSIGQQYSAGSTTSTYTTNQIGPMVTNETFGLTGTTFNQGVSRYEIITPANVSRSATGANAEKVTRNLSQETLF